jgi:hypothetical protein
MNYFKHLRHNTVATYLQCKQPNSCGPQTAVRPILNVKNILKIIQKCFPFLIPNFNCNGMHYASLLYKVSNAPYVAHEIHNTPPADEFDSCTPPVFKKGQKT